MTESSKKTSKPLKNRIRGHPVLNFDWDRKVLSFKYKGKNIAAYEGETIASALYANGGRTFSYSFKYQRPRGWFCGIGKCCSCMMRVDGEPNVRTCVTRAREGMVVEPQKYVPFYGPIALHFFRRFSGTRILPVGFHYRRFTRRRILRKLFYWGMQQFSGMGRYPDFVANDPVVKRKPVPILEKSIVVVGGGPAGLEAALQAATAGAKVTLVDENRALGGQLIKQTHEYSRLAKNEDVKRGIDIAKEIAMSIRSHKNIEIMLESRIVGIYEGSLLGVTIGEEFDQKFVKMKARKIIIATGAYERLLQFENNDLPGIYGVVGLQSLMNQHGIVPGQKALIIGSGDLGLIMADQFKQAGVLVQAIVEVPPQVGNHLVYGSTVPHLDVTRFTGYTIKKALGRNSVKGAIIHRTDENGQEIRGTSKHIKCDIICLATGLKPAFELLAQAGAELQFVSKLGGHVPLRTQYLETTTSGVYAIGDVSGTEDANAARLEGRIAGISAARAIGKSMTELDDVLSETQEKLAEIRSSPLRERIQSALAQLKIEGD
ncbi:MAG: FAD-dependent oxidoreductase [Candidatus Heimdallarchaeota archaeon]